jgi:3-hydroxyacyl-[acyl-carrier-protein] dehydratase
MQTPDIALLPHRPPFVFLTEVGEVELTVRGQASWEVSGDEPFFQGHFPERPIVPGVLLGEALAQLSGLVMFKVPAPNDRATVKLAQLDLRFPDAIQPPATIALESIVDRRLGGLTRFKVRAAVCGQVVAVGTLVLALSDDTALGEV